MLLKLTFSSLSSLTLLLVGVILSSVGPIKQSSHFNSIISRYLVAIKYFTKMC